MRPGSFRGRRGQHPGIDVDPSAVRRARTEAGLSLAQVVGDQFTRGALYMVEQGKARPSMRMLALISRRTGRPVSYFLRSMASDDKLRSAVDELARLVAVEEFTAAVEAGEKLVALQMPTPVEAEARLLLGRAFVRLFDGRCARPQLDRARELYELLTDQVMQAEVLDELACAHYLNDDPRAVSLAWQALDCVERLRTPPPDLLVRILLHLGSFLLRVQDWSRAADCYRRALTVEQPAPRIRHRAMLHDQLGQATQRLGHRGESLQHAYQAHELYRATKDPVDAVRAENNLGWVLLQQGELDAAAPHLERALALCERHQLERQGRADVLLNLAELYIARDELGAAAERLAGALKLAVALNQRHDQATAWRMRGRLYRRKGEHDAAYEAYAKAMEMLGELELDAELAQVHDECARMLDEQGRVHEAAESWRRSAAAAFRAMLQAHRGGADNLDAEHSRASAR